MPVMDHLIVALVLTFCGNAFSIFTAQVTDYNAYVPRFNYNVKRDDYPPQQKHNLAPRYAITYVTTPGYAPYLYQRYAAKPRHYYENYKTGIAVPQRNYYASIVPVASREYNSREKYVPIKSARFIPLKSRYDSREKYSQMKANYGRKHSFSPYIVQEQDNFKSALVAIQPTSIHFKSSPIQKHSMEPFAKALPRSHVNRKSRKYIT
jgi:hypothetical protein